MVFPLLQNSNAVLHLFIVINVSYITQILSYTKARIISLSELYWNILPEKLKGMLG